MARSSSASARHKRPTAGTHRGASHRTSKGARAPRDHRRMHEATWSRADALAVLESPERRASQDPKALWRRVGLRKGDTVVDVGAGSGFFAFPAATMVGPAGRVYAVDTSPELVEFIRDRASRGKVPNVESLLSTPTRIPLEDAAADVALLSNVLHGIPPKTVTEAIRVLRPGGRLVDIDWKKRETADGPPIQHRLSALEARRALSAHGLTPIDSFELGPSHYVLVFERPRPPRLPGHLVSAE